MQVVSLQTGSVKASQQGTGLLQHHPILPHVRTRHATAGPRFMS